MNNRHRKEAFLNFLKRFYIFIILLAIYVPLIIIIVVSFCGQTERGNINVNFGTATAINYFELFADDDFLNGLFNTFILSIIVVPVSVFIAIFVCYGLWKAKQPTKFIYLNTSRISIVNPEAITGISLLLLFSSTIIPLGANLGFATVLLAHISFCTPYALITIYPRIAKMKSNMVLASYDLGASRIRTLFKVVIPYLTPAIISASVIVLAMSWDDFIITNLVNGSWQTLGTLIYNTRKGIKAWVITFGALMVIIIMAIVFGLFGYRLAQERKTHKRNLNNAKQI